MTICNNQSIKMMKDVIDKDNRNIKRPRLVLMPRKLTASLCNNVLRDLGEVNFCRAYGNCLNHKVLSVR